MTYDYERGAAPASSTFLIAYDINKKDPREAASVAAKRRRDVLDAIGGIGPHLMLSESAYAVKTTLSAQAIAHRLTPFLLAETDECTIVELRGPAHGMSAPGGQETHLWLREMLGESSGQ